jgi:hypothetical protein
MAEWEKVRRHIIAGGVKGFTITLLNEASRETIYAGGEYKDDPQAALKAALRMSAVRTLVEDPPPAQRSGT